MWINCHTNIPLSLASFNVADSVFRQSTLNTWSILGQQMMKIPRSKLKSETKVPVGLCARKNFNFQDKCAIPALNIFPRMFKLTFPCSVFPQLALLEMISKWSRKIRKGEDYSFVMKPSDRDWEKLQKRFLKEILMRLKNINFLLDFCLFSLELLPLLFFPRTSDSLTLFSVWIELHVMTVCRF